MMDWFVAGSMAGAVAGGLSTGYVRHWMQGAREKRALQALMTQIHLKRVLAESGPGIVDPDHDAARCRSAVLDIRQALRETLSELRPGSTSPAAALLEMHRACETYLRETEGNRHNYEARLRELRPVLNQGARRLSSGRHVQYLAPGQRTAVRRDAVAAGASGRPAAHSAGNRERALPIRGNVPAPAASGAAHADGARRLMAHAGSGAHSGSDSHQRG